MSVQKDVPTPSVCVTQRTFVGDWTPTLLLCSLSTLMYDWSTARISPPIAARRLPVRVSRGGHVPVGGFVIACICSFFATRSYCCTVHCQTHPAGVLVKKVAMSGQTDEFCLVEPLTAVGDDSGQSPGQPRGAECVVFAAPAPTAAPDTPAPPPAGPPTNANSCL
ncbi:unnamed protein product, partial [Ectocarpus sp. 12 AP-2014]